jgi:hypothetical protein
MSPCESNILVLYNLILTGSEFSSTILTAESIILAAEILIFHTNCLQTLLTIIFSALLLVNDILYYASARGRHNYVLFKQ